MVYQHMERLNGSGCPRGLSGAAILPGARIVAVACKAAKMLTARGPEAPADVEQTTKALEHERGTLFDAKVVDACVRLIREKVYAIPAQSAAIMRMRECLLPAQADARSTSGCVSASGSFPDLQRV